AVTGVPGHQTYVWFILTQLVLGIVSVMLMHDCLRRISKSLGLVATALYIATFIGFVYSKSIMTEEIYLFGWCLCIQRRLGLSVDWSAVTVGADDSCFTHSRPDASAGGICHCRRP